MFIFEPVGSFLSKATLYVAGAFVLALPFIFGASVFRYVYAIRKNKKAPGTYSGLEMRKRKLFLIISSVLLGVVVALLVGLAVIIVSAVAYM